MYVCPDLPGPEAASGHNLLRAGLVDPAAAKLSAAHFPDFHFNNFPIDRVSIGKVFLVAFTCKLW